MANSAACNYIYIHLSSNFTIIHRASQQHPFPAVPKSMPPQGLQMLALDWSTALVPVQRGQEMLYCRHAEHLSNVQVLAVLHHNL